MRCRHYRDVAGSLIYMAIQARPVRSAHIDTGSSARRNIPDGTGEVFRSWVCGGARRHLDDDRMRTGTAFDPACPSAAADLQSVESKRSAADSETPVSPNAPGVVPGSGVQPYSSSCSVFHRGPCFPDYLPPIGQDLRLTIVSTDETDPASKPGSDSAKEAGHADTAPVDSIRAMYDALRACWIPPPKDSARQGIEYTMRFAFKRNGEITAPPRVTYSSREASAVVRDVYRDAVNAALTRCTPLRFSKSMGGAVAGRPIAIRFVDNRTIDGGKLPQ